METEQVSQPDVNVKVRNIGGIDRADVTLSPGVTVLAGRNATNRTSFLHAVMAAIGSRNVSLKGDAEEGEAELEIGSDTYRRTLTRAGSTVNFEGEAYLDDPELADLFAFLLEDNDARQAVARGDDLREIIMRPVDTDQIEAEIAQLEAEKRRCDEEIKELERKERELPELEQQRTEFEQDLEQKQSELEAVLETIEKLDADLEESKSQKQELEEAFEELRRARSAVENTEFQIETVDETLDDLEAEREELEDRLEHLRSEEQEHDEQRIAGKIEELRDRKRAYEDRISQLQSIVRFNEELLEGDGLGIGLSNDDDSASVTDQLLADADTTCWTCGSSVNPDRIREMVDRLRSLRQEQMSERNEIRERIDELSAKRKELIDHQETLERTEDRLADIETEIEEAQERLEILEEQLLEQRSSVEELADRTESLGTGDYDEIVQRHREANELELEIERIESKLSDVNFKIEEREEAATKREELEEQREHIASQLTELRTTVERLESEAIESFNDHIAAVLDILEYENIERIWIDRKERTVREGRKKVTRSEFSLNIIRTTSDGTSYQDTVDHLSESERIVTGLVFALAGYLVHEVHDVVPFMLLDSLEAIDAERLARLIEYFRGYVDYLVVALLPEDADGLPDDYTYVSDI